MRTAAGGADDHDAVPHKVCLVQLDALVEPWRVRLQAPLLRYLPDSAGKLTQSCEGNMLSP